jgi:sulfhydrogenase subunit delta
VSTRQVLGALPACSRVPARSRSEKVCVECKRKGQVCVLVAKGEPCLGPVTATGCGALCPGLGRDCYGCYGPAENPNVDSLTRWLRARGMDAEAIARRFQYQHSGAPAFRAAARAVGKRGGHDSGD